MQQKIIDLTQLLNGKITVYPDTVAPTFEVSNTVAKDGFTEMQMSMASHTGTHIDAPCHVVQDARSLDQFSVDRFVGKAIVIPCRGRNEISMEYLQTFEEKIAKVDFILFYTGWQEKWGTSGYFDDCPIPTGAAAQWLTKFNLKGIGLMLSHWIR